MLLGDTKETDKKLGKELRDSGSLLDFNNQAGNCGQKWPPTLRTCAGPPAISTSPIYKGGGCKTKGVSLCKRRWALARVWVGLPTFSKRINSNLFCPLKASDMSANRNVNPKPRTYMRPWQSTKLSSSQCSVQRRRGAQTGGTDLKSSNLLRMQPHMSFKEQRSLNVRTHLQLICLHCVPHLPEIFLLHFLLFCREDRAAERDIAGQRISQLPISNGRKLARGLQRV